MVLEAEGLPQSCKKGRAQVFSQMGPTADSSKEEKSIDQHFPEAQINCASEARMAQSAATATCARWVRSVSGRCEAANASNALRIIVHNTVITKVSVNQDLHIVSRKRFCMQHPC